MHVHLASLAHASALQIRDAIRRLTTLQPPIEAVRDERAFLGGVEVNDSSWNEWQETTFDVRQTHA